MLLYSVSPPCLFFELFNAQYKDNKSCTRIVTIKLYLRRTLVLREFMELNEAKKAACNLRVRIIDRS